MLAKRKLVEFMAARKREAQRIEESDGPFGYEYLSISHILGAKLPADSPDPLQVAHFPEMNATAYLTNDWEEPYFHIDRANSIATLMLTGLTGIKRFKKASRWADQFLKGIFGFEWLFMRNLKSQTMKTRRNRLREHSGSGCCLVYRSRGQITQPLNLRAGRKYSDIGIALDALDGSVIREAHKLNVRSVTTAISIAMTDTNGSPETRFLTDNIHLVDKNENVIYVRTLKMGAVGITVTTMTPDQFTASVERYTAGLGADRKLASAASLFALSQHRSNDNLRSFFASWSALELLIYNLEKKYRERFQVLLRDPDIDLPPWDQDFLTIDIGKYRLRDRFYAVSCSMNLSEAEVDTDKFNELNSKRNKYYHRFEMPDTELPTQEVQTLFRKYLKIDLAEQKAKI